jgi:WD40 repeat protein
MSGRGRPAEVPAIWRVGEVIDGRYQVTQVLGQGGMGVVYRVRHLAWGTDLAVKCPRPELFRNEADRERFVAEAETWVSLGLHPNVCGCYYVRLLGGIPRVFAEYLSGGSLRDWIEDRRLYRGDPLAVSARILDVAIQVARGLDHAHTAGRGLVHQDVKPANVLLDDQGDAVTAKITDFGLARARAAATAAPGRAAPPGASILMPYGGRTKQYASPEQAARRALGRRTDVYSFAVSVLEMYTGGVTWMTGPAAAEALAAFRAGPAAGPGLPVIPAGVAGLLGQCLREDPGDRPGSLAQVAAELAGSYRRTTGHPYPRPAPSASELRAGELNNRALSLLDLGRPGEAERAFAAALAADPRHLEAAYNSGLRRWRGGAVTDEDLVAELEAVRADTGDSWQARHLLAQVQLERGDLAAARGLLEGVEREAPGEPEVRAALRAVRSGPPARRTRAPQAAQDLTSEPVTYLSVRLSADGRLALTGGGYRGTVRLWDLRSGQCRKTLDGHGERVDAIDLTPDGHFAVSAGADETVRFWDLTTGQCLRHISARADRVRLSAGGRIAVWGRQDGKVQLWNTRSGQSWSTPGGHDVAVERIEVCPDGGRALTSGWERGSAHATVRLWDLISGSCQRVLSGHTSSVTAMCFSADGQTAAVGCHDGTIALWNTGDGSRVRVLAGGCTAHLSLSADGRFMLCGESDTVQFWDLHAGRRLRTFRGELRQVGTVLLGADAGFGLAASACERRDEELPVRVRELDLPGGCTARPSLSRPRSQTELRRLDAQVTALVAEADEAMAAGRYPAALGLLTRARATAGYERAPRVVSAWWSLARHTVRTGVRAGWPRQTLDGHAGGVGAVDISADGRIAVSAGSDGTVRQWDIDSSTCTRVLKGHQGPVKSVCLSADGRLVLSGGQNGVVRLWRLDTGECLRVLMTNLHPVARSVPVRFSADGQRAMVGCGDGRVRLWDLRTGRQERTLEGHGGDIAAVWAGGDGRLATSAGSDSVRLWDLDSGRCLRALHGHAGAAASVCISADGTSVLSCGQGYDRTIRSWDIATGDCARVFDDRGSLPFAVRLSGDGRLAVSAGRDALIRVWDVGTGRCLRALGDRGVSLTCLALSRDARFVLSGGGDGTVRVWELDVGLTAREAADWDDGATPYLDVFLRRYGPRWTAEDVDVLLRLLQDAGYGWLRASGVRARLGCMTADSRAATPSAAGGEVPAR